MSSPRPVSVFRPPASGYEAPPGVSWRPMSSPPADLASCLNCETPLAGAFCVRCGQKVRALDPTVADFLHDFSHEMLHFDGKIFRSVGALLFRPGLLTKDYFAGRRARWVSPIRLYLVFSVAYFALMSLDESGGDDASHAASRLMVVLLPVFAWFTSLVATKRRNFPQHLGAAMSAPAGVRNFVCETDSQTTAL